MMRPLELHRGNRIGWLRAAADATRSAVLVAGVAGLAAGALSMAAGEYVSVSSQADTEQADLDVGASRAGARRRRRDA
jgi:VIT1/CCC1 family predicted Fe2+/Mn2+ transporter